MWVKRLPNVVAALNHQVHTVDGEKACRHNQGPTVFTQPLTPYQRPVEEAEETLPSNVEVRFLLFPGELEGVERRATDPNWALETFQLTCAMIKPGQPVLYWLRNGP